MLAVYVASECCNFNEDMTTGVSCLQREQEEAAEVYKEFIESFEESEKGLNRAWVKGGVVNPEKGDAVVFILYML